MDRTRRQERRRCRRYPLAFPIRYRVTQRNAPPLTGAGTTYDISLSGVSFLCRQPLPLGAHIELMAEWPAKPNENSPRELRMTGFVVRSDQSGSAVLVTSHKLCVDAEVDLPFAASA